MSGIVGGDKDPEKKLQSMRAWDAASGNRLTSKHWANQRRSEQINQEIARDLNTLRQRCRVVRQNNGFAAGMVETWVSDVIGAEGPKLQVIVPQSDSASAEVSSFAKRYVRQVESLWNAWAEMPDYSGEWSLVDLLQINEAMLWDNGEGLFQLVSSSSDRLPVSLRLLQIHPRLLKTPYFIGMKNRFIVNGIERTRDGRPLKYWIDQSPETEWDSGTGMDFISVRAENIIHDFDPIEPKQSRGIPRLAPVLDVVAQLQDYDRDVMQAARTAAMISAFIWSQDSEAEDIPEAGSSMELQPGTLMTLPGGWRPEQMQAQQPSAMYEMFRREKIREIGRPVCMPYMIAAADSSNHNFSSARFDAQGYDRVLKKRQRRLERRTLRPLLREIIKEGQIVGVVGPEPEGAQYVYVWPSRPHVDPIKEANAWRTRLEDGSAAQAHVCADYGLDVDQVRELRRREGLPEGMIMDRKVMAQAQEKETENALSD